MEIKERDVREIASEDMDEDGAGMPQPKQIGVA